MILISKSKKGKHKVRKEKVLEEMLGFIVSDACLQDKWLRDAPQILSLILTRACRLNKDFPEHLANVVISQMKELVTKELEIRT